MAFTAPAITTTITATGYVGEVNTNFDHINTALISIQNELPAVSGLSHNARNMALVDPANIVPSGLIGPHSFLPVLNSLHSVLTISHPVSGTALDPVATESRVSIAALYHSSSVTPSGSPFDLTTISGATSGQTKRMIVAVRSRGAPECEVTVLQSDDAAQDAAMYAEYLVLYSFNFTNTAGVYSVKDMVRECRVIVDNLGYQEVVDKQDLLTMNIANASPTLSTNKRYGMFAPYDCVVVKAFARASTTATSGSLILKLEVEESIDEFLRFSELETDATASVTVAENETTYTMAGTTPPYPVREGEWIYLDISGTPSGVENLAVGIVIKKIYHTVVRS